MTMVSDDKVSRGAIDVSLTGRSNVLTFLSKTWLSINWRAWHYLGTQDIVVVCALHLYQFTLMIFQPSVEEATCILALFDILRLFVSHDGAEYIYIFVYLAMILALIGAFGKLGWLRLILLIPQQIVLAGMAWGGLIGTFEGRYLDGTKIPWAHVSADQASYAALCIMHFLAMLRRSRDPHG